MLFLFGKIVVSLKPTVDPIHLGFWLLCLPVQSFFGRTFRFSTEKWVIFKHDEIRWTYNFSLGMLLLLCSFSSSGGDLVCSSKGFLASGNLGGESREKASFLFRKLSGVVDTPEELLLALEVLLFFGEEESDALFRVDIVDDEVFIGSAGGGDALLVLGMSWGCFGDVEASFFGDRSRFPDDELLP